MTEHPFITGLRQFFDAHPHIKPATISARVGDKSTIRKLLDGTVRTPTLATAVKIAEELGTTVESIIGLEPKVFIPVLGRVGAGAQVPLVDTDEVMGGMFRVGAPAQLLRRGSATQFAAVEVEGDSMAPHYQPGDILFYSRATHEGILDEDIGRPCIVAGTDGNAWVKQVKRGDEPGLFHLISLNPTGENMHNREIKWASRVILALPEDMTDRSNSEVL